MLVLAVASLAAAQQVPTPVIRIGDWVEIGNEVFMNFIASTDIRYRTTHNYDFEDRVMDGVASRNPTASTLYVGEGDFSQVEARLGVDMRYQKNLTMQVIAEAQYIIDGNLIDDRHNTTTPGANPSVTGVAASPENNGFHIERYWIDYAFYGTPVRLRVGADLWQLDQAGILGDDDPRIAVFFTLGPKNEIELSAAAVIQQEAARLGLQNDNDFIYYTFSGAFNMKPHRIQLDLAYFRDRFTGASGQGLATGQSTDSVLIMPSFSTRMGIITALVEGALVLGTADGNNLTDCSAAAGFQRCEYDIFAWGAIAYVEANLVNGMIRPFAGLIYGSGDDDPNDEDLEGFFTLPQREITLITNSPYFAFLDTSPSVGDWGPAAPARAPGAGGNLFRHTTGSPFADLLGNATHAGISTTYSNPGTLLIPVGVKIAPLQGHEILPYYLYVGMTDASTLRAALGPGTGHIHNNLYHEFGLVYTWTLSPYFDIRLNGHVLLPASGAEDIARTVDCNPAAAGFQPCEGEDPALKGEVRFRARF
jgi:hypothetical protein